MSEFPREVFSWVCAQNAAHTWAPGGHLLPVCQRCTGMYTGAAIALVLLVLFRPQPGAVFRWLHAALVLAMTPFGFHLVEHGAHLRTASGQWFGIGVVGLLWLLPARMLIGNARRPGNGRLHFLLGAASLLLLPALIVWGGMPAAALISGMALAGLMVLAGLVLANLWIFISWIVAAPSAAQDE